MGKHFAEPWRTLWIIGTLFYVIDAKMQVVALPSIQQGSKDQVEQFLKFQAASAEEMLSPGLNSVNGLAKIPLPSDSTVSNGKAKAASMDSENLPKGIQVHPSRGRLITSEAETDEEEEDADNDDEPQLDDDDPKEKSETAEKRRKSILKNRIAPLLSMLPIIMQLFSLPGAIATIKMSLLKSIFVAKLAMFFMLINVLKNYQQPEVVVVHQAQHHQHHYHEYPKFEEDIKDDSWWRK